MQTSGIFKLLYLLNLLFKKEYTKSEIIEEYEKINIKITKTLISNYIKTLIDNGINIEITKNSKKESIYSLKKEEFILSFTKKELNAISDAKKLLFMQKNYNNIRKTMRMFYKLACHIEDDETRMEFIDFGYYSTINWNLVCQLEKHCNEKNIITLDYILPKGGNKFITMHVDKMGISETSHRLYLYGALQNDKEISFLPVDRIYMVKKIVRENLRFNLHSKIMTYIVKKDAYERLKQDNKERILKTEGEYITIQRPIDNEFNITQRLFYFCPDVYYISDEKIKILFKEKLEILKRTYCNELDK